MVFRKELFIGAGGIAFELIEERMALGLGFVNSDGSADWISYYRWLREISICRAEALITHRFCEGLWDDIRIRNESFQNRMVSIVIRMRKAWMQIRGGAIVGNGNIEAVPDVLPLPPTGIVRFEGIAI